MLVQVWLPQLAEVAEGFRRTAAAVLNPLFLEAQATARLGELQKKVAKQLISNSRATIVEIIAQVKTLPDKA